MSKEGTAYDRWDLRLFIFSLVGTFFSLSLALGLGAVSLAAWIGGDSIGAQSAQATSAGLFALAALGVPAIYNSGRSLLGRAAPGARRPSRRWMSVVWLFPLGLFLGYLGYERSFLTVLLGPLGQVAAIGAPAAVLVVLLRRAGPAIRARRAWGHFLLGLWAVPAVALVVEGVVLLATLFIAALGLSFSPVGPELILQLQQIAELGDPTLAAELIAEVAFRPAIILLVSAFLTLIVPAIEEVLKTASVWPLLPSRIRADEAFLGGALGGTGFALSEALFLTPPAGGWILVASARAGATLMHATATGIAAWAAAEGLVRSRWARAGAGLLAAVALHGLWNAGAVAIGLSQLGLEIGVETPEEILRSVGSGGVVLNVSLTVLAFWLMRSFQRRLAPDGASEAAAGEVA